MKKWILPKNAKIAIDHRQRPKSTRVSNDQGYTLKLKVVWEKKY